MCHPNYWTVGVRIINSCIFVSIGCDWPSYSICFGSLFCFCFLPCSVTWSKPSWFRCIFLSEVQLNFSALSSPLPVTNFYNTTEVLEVGEQVFGFIGWVSWYMFLWKLLNAYRNEKSTEILFPIYCSTPHKRQTTPSLSCKQFYWTLV